MLLLVSSACLCYNFGLCWLWAHIAVLCYDYLIISLCSAFVSAVFVIPHPQAAQAQNQQQFLVPLPEVSFVRTITSQTYQFHHVVFEADHDNQSLWLTVTLSAMLIVPSHFTHNTMSPKYHVLWWYSQALYDIRRVKQGQGAMPCL